MRRSAPCQPANPHRTNSTPSRPVRHSPTAVGSRPRAAASPASRQAAASRASTTTARPQYDSPEYEDDDEKDSCGTTLDSKGDTLECYYCALKDRCLPCYGCTGNPRTCREGACTQAMAGPGFERPGPRDDWWVADPPPLPPPPVPPPLMPPAPPPATVPIGLLVGVLAGGAFILVGIAIVVVCCLRRKRRPATARSRPPPPPPPSPPRPRRRRRRRRRRLSNASDPALGGISFSSGSRKLSVHSPAAKVGAGITGGARQPSVGFVSHFKEEAAMEARFLQTELEQSLGRQARESPRRSAHHPQPHTRHAHLSLALGPSALPRLGRPPRPARAARARQAERGAPPPAVDHRPRRPSACSSSSPRSTTASPSSASRSSAATRAPASITARRRPSSPTSTRASTAARRRSSRRTASPTSSTRRTSCRARCRR